MLVAAARRLFIAHGYADTSTPDISEEAGVSRGALYHQFADKRALFEAVITSEAEAVAWEIERATPEHNNGNAHLITGAQAYLQAMGKEGRCRLLLVDGPTVLGPAQMRSIDGQSGATTLVNGLREIAPGADIDRLAASADLLSAAFDRAALAIDQGGAKDVYEAAVIELIETVAERLSAD
ncbi:TetR/AcrR family transcriptional regulator [Devosia crocina]|nr:TetR/AcrR family transcriptional regulator [Devosia crocina]